MYFEIYNAIFKHYKLYALVHLWYHRPLACTQHISGNMFAEAGSAHLSGLLYVKMRIKQIMEMLKLHFPL
jgi:hypothetical protein